MYNLQVAARVAIVHVSQCDAASTNNNNNLYQFEKLYSHHPTAHQLWYQEY